MAETLESRLTPCRFRWQSARILQRNKSARWSNIYFQGETQGKFLRGTLTTFVASRWPESKLNPPRVGSNKNRRGSELWTAHRNEFGIPGGSRDSCHRSRVVDLITGSGRLLRFRRLYRSTEDGNEMGRKEKERSVNGGEINKGGGKDDAVDNG